VWQKSNPSLYDIIDPSVIESDINDAQVSPEKIPELKAKTFNVWGGGGKKSWIPLEIFQKNKDVKVDFEDFENMVCCSATDLSNIDDLTVYSLIFQHEGKEYYKHRFYIPEAMAYQKYKKENINFFQWIDQGLITATPGNTVNYDFIVNDFLNDAELYKIIALGYDKWQSHDVIEKVEAERPDILLIEIEQSLKKLSPLTKSYEKAIKDGLIVDNNPVMAWMINNAEIRPDPNGNYKPMKPSKTSTRRIDGVITSIMCHGLAHNPEVITPPPTLTFNDVKSLF
jgi:phage terminase large subunit-like protein